MIHTQINHFANAIEAIMPRVLQELGTEAVTYSKENFRRQGFNAEKWKPRKKDKTPGRAVLIKTGHLQNSIHITSRTASSVAVGTDVVYARIHNEGGDINMPARAQVINLRLIKRAAGEGYDFRFGKKTHKRVARMGVMVPEHTIGMPRRQFIGMTPELKQRLQIIIRKEISTAFKIVSQR